MKAWLVILLASLMMVVGSSAWATTVTCNIDTVGDLTTYTYTLTSMEAGDYISSFHVFALLDLSLIVGNTAPANWGFDAFIDPEPGVGADIYWYANSPLDAIPNLGVRQFSLSVPSWTTVDTEHIVPGCFGNWGYECLSWPGAVMVSYTTVPVPNSMANPAVPEPASIVGLLLGLGAVARKYRRKT